MEVFNQGSGFVSWRETRLTAGWHGNGIWAAVINRWKLTESDLESLTEVIELKGLIPQAPSFQDASCADSGSGLPLPPSTEVQLKASIFLFLTRLCPVFLLS